ncbi:unnamed protein product [Schistosoma turkestanicum]|nr:unnamed protein product [Schistosoma turkestanicum]
MASFKLTSFEHAERICPNLLQLLIYLQIFCLCQTISPIHSLSILRSYPTVDDVTNAEDLWSLNDHEKKYPINRFGEFNRNLNRILLRQQFYPEENQEPLENRKFYNYISWSNKKSINLCKEKLYFEPYYLLMLYKIIYHNLTDSLLIKTDSTI